MQAHRSTKGATTADSEAQARIEFRSWRQSYAQVSPERTIWNLPQELSKFIHELSMEANLKKCYADEPLVMPLERNSC
ncbi:hypothetical protein Tco_1304014 [Tanacetum coccineum]